MKIVKEFPPIYKKILAHGMQPSKGVVITVGDTLYNPNGGYIPPELMAHEEVHTRQQGTNPDKWWERYLTDTEFRLSQEVEAYSVQYKAFCKTHKDRNIRFKYLNALANDLSGPIYGNIIDKSTALKLIF